MFHVSCLGIQWLHDIWISEKIKIDYLKNKELSKWNKKLFFLASQVLSFRHAKQTSKNVVDPTIKVMELDMNLHHGCSYQIWQYFLSGILAFSCPFLHKWSNSPQACPRKRVLYHSVLLGKQLFFRCHLNSSYEVPTQLF